MHYRMDVPRVCGSFLLVPNLNCILFTTTRDVRFSVRIKLNRNIIKRESR